MANHLPHVDGQIPAMLRLLAESDAQQLAVLDPAERETLFSSLCLTLMRATYHRHRFDMILDESTARANSQRGAFVMDAIAKYAVFEALGLLVAARTAIDEIGFIGARRRGDVLHDADRADVAGQIRRENGSPELRAISSSYASWFEDVNEYRNALAHRGYSERLGIHPPESPHAEANDPEWNVLLLPDRSSVVRPRRPHEWTYEEGRRLEGLVHDVHHGLLCLVQEIGTALWGGAVPARGTIDTPSGPLMLVVHRP